VSYSAESALCLAPYLYLGVTPKASKASLASRAGLRASSLVSIFQEKSANSFSLCSIPYEPFTPASSNCVTHASSELYTAAAALVRGHSPILFPRSELKTDLVLLSL